MTPTEWRRGGHKRHERQSRDPAADPTPDTLASRGEFGVTGTRLSVETGRTVRDVAARRLHAHVTEVFEPGQGLAVGLVDLDGEAVRPGGDDSDGLELEGVGHRSLL